MSELDELQAFMSEALRRRRDLTRDPEASREAERLIDASAHFSSSRHLEIYREQYWLRHTGSLLEDFPGVAGILGQSAWNRLTEEYLAAHPPTSFSLQKLGQNLPAFVEKVAFLEQPELVLDMARLEWIHVELFDAPAPPRLNADALAGIEEDELARTRLTLAPTLRLLRVTYPVVGLRNRLLREPEASIARPAPEPATLVIYRQELTMVQQRLRRAPFTLLEALDRGATLGEACEVACALGPDEAHSVESEVGAWFADWVHRGFVTGLERPLGVR